jgi:hypothetical protein
MLEVLLASEAARRRGLTLQALRDAHPIERLAWRWVLFNEKAMADTDGLANSLTVRYEDLCKHPVGMTKRMFRFAELEWQGQSERFIERSISAESKEYYGLIKDPLRSADKWRDELGKQDIERIMAIARHIPAGRLFLMDDA